MIDRRTFLGFSAMSLFAGCRSLTAMAERMAAPEFDDNLTVFVTDIHVSGSLGRPRAPLRWLEQFVDEVLAMRPRPKRVVSLGDLAYLCGLPEDYAMSKPALKRLEAAGIELVFCMGNHDRRSAFAAAWPGHLERSPVPGKLMRVVSLGTADLIVLDGLQGTDDRPRNSMGPGAGFLYPDEFAWCQRELPNWKRPFFVCAHQGIHEFSFTKPGDKKPTPLVAWLAQNAPMFKGYIHGHEHKWRSEWICPSWPTSKAVRTLCLPSNGSWGDIGYAIFRTSADRAVCSLEIRDFFLPCEPDTSDRPAAWKAAVEEIRGQKVTFLYERGE